MGKSLEEYAAQHPKEQPLQERAAMLDTAHAVQERQEERDKAAQLKISILTQLKQGNAPQSILYTALATIGLLSHDAEWQTAAQSVLDSTYADLAQQSLLIDNAAIEAQRRDSMQAAYYEKLQKQLKRQLSGCQRIEKKLNEALAEIEGLDEEDLWAV